MGAVSIRSLPVGIGMDEEERKRRYLSMQQTQTPTQPQQKPTRAQFEEMQKRHAQSQRGMSGVRQYRNSPRTLSNAYRNGMAQTQPQRGRGGYVMLNNGNGNNGNGTHTTVITET